MQFFSLSGLQLTSSCFSCHLFFSFSRPTAQVSSVKSGCDAPGLDAVAEAACRARKYEDDMLEDKFLAAGGNEDEMEQQADGLEDSGFNGSTTTSPTMTTSPTAMSTGSVNSDEEVAAKSLMFLAAQAHSSSNTSRKRGRPKKHDPSAKRACMSSARGHGSSRRKVKKPARYIPDDAVVINESPSVKEPSKETKRSKKVSSHKSH